MWEVALYAPFTGTDKAGIVREGTSLGVPYELTWSCYKGGERHCGRCGTFVERREAFHLANVPDPPESEDPDYCMAVIAQMKATDGGGTGGAEKGRVRKEGGRPGSSGRVVTRRNKKNTGNDKR